MFDLGPFSVFRLCSANHRPGYWSNLPCDWLSTAWAYSEQETENGPWSLEVTAPDTCQLIKVIFIHGTMLHVWSLWCSWRAPNLSGNLYRNMTPHCIGSDKACIRWGSECRLWKIWMVWEVNGMSFWFNLTQSRGPAAYPCLHNSVANEGKRCIYKVLFPWRPLDHPRTVPSVFEI